MYAADAQIYFEFPGTPAAGVFLSRHVTQNVLSFPFLHQNAAGVQYNKMPSTLEMFSVQEMMLCNRRLQRFQHASSNMGNTNKLEDWQAFETPISARHMALKSVLRDG